MTLSNQSKMRTRLMLVLCTSALVPLCVSAAKAESRSLARSNFATSNLAKREIKENESAAMGSPNLPADKSTAQSTAGSAPLFYCKFRHWVVDIDNILDQTLGAQNRTCSFTLGDRTWQENGVGACLYRQWTAAFFKNQVGVVKMQIENLVNPNQPVNITVLSRPVSMWEPQTGAFMPWRVLSNYRDFYLHLRMDEPQPAASWLTQPELLRALAGQKDPRLSDIALVVDSKVQQVSDVKMRASGRLSFYVEAQQEAPVYNVNFTTNWGLLSGAPGSKPAMRPSPNGCSESPFDFFSFGKRAFDVQLEAK